MQNIRGSELPEHRISEIYNPHLVTFFYWEEINLSGQWFGMASRTNTNKNMCCKKD
jgi:hypothetical protein